MASTIPDSLRHLSTKQDKSYYAVSDSQVAKLTGDESHERLHSGNSFLIASLNTSLSSGATHVVAFSTPDSTGSSIDVLPLVQAKGDALFRIWESATVTQGTGTSKKINNKDRQSETTSKILDLGSTPTAGQFSNGGVTITAYGTNIFEEVIGLSGTSDSAGEFLLKSDTTYVFEVISRAASNRVGLNIRIHEK